MISFFTYIKISKNSSAKNYQDYGSVILVDLGHFSIGYKANLKNHYHEIFLAYFHLHLKRHQTVFINLN